MSSCRPSHRTTRYRTGVTAVLTTLTLVLCTSCVQTVQRVDLTRYLGLWYQPLGYSLPFTAGLVGITADYGLNPDGTVSVHNRGFRGSCTGPVSEITGIATVTSAVQFL